MPTLRITGPRASIDALADLARHWPGGEACFSVWDESKHPRAEDGRFGDKEGDEVIGKGSGGEVVARGGNAYKKARGREGAVYDALRGAPGVAPGRQEGDHIVTPLYKNVVSIDDTPAERRHSLAPLIGKHVAEIASAIGALTDAGYDYNDPLQFGVAADKGFELFDFSNAEKTSRRDAAGNNLDHLGNFYTMFGMPKLAGVVSRARELLDVVGDPDSIDFLKGSDEEGDALALTAERLTAQLDGREPKYFYFATNAREIPRVVSTPHAGGARVILSDIPLEEAFLREWEITPLLHSPPRAVDAEAAFEVRHAPKGQKGKHAGGRFLPRAGGEAGGGEGAPEARGAAKPSGEEKPAAKAESTPAKAAGATPSGQKPGTHAQARGGFLGRLAKKARAFGLSLFHAPKGDDGRPHSWDAVSGLAPAERLEQSPAVRAEAARLDGAKKGAWEYLAQGGDPEATKADVAARCQALVDSLAVHSRVKNEATLLLILGGKFKNQFETGMSMAVLDPKGRSAAEMRGQGFPPDTPADARPIYGYLAPADGDRYHDAARGYGDVVVRLRDAVKQDATVSFGDSWQGTSNGDFLPSPMTAVSHRSVDPQALAAVGTGSVDGFTHFERSHKTYIEAQLANAVGPEDIEAVEFRHAPSEEVIRRLEGRGIPWKLYGPEAAFARGEADMATEEGGRWVVLYEADEGGGRTAYLVGREPADTVHVFRPGEPPGPATSLEAAAAHMPHHEWREPTDPEAVLKLLEEAGGADAG